MAVIESTPQPQNTAQQRPGTEQSTPKKEFLNYIHSFRGLAILHIVAGHSISLLRWPSANSTERLLGCLLSGGSVFFVFIAGYLFHHLSARFAYKAYLLNKLKNVVCPYFLMSLPAIILWTAIAQRPDIWSGFYDGPVAKQIAVFYLTGGHVTAYWFIPMICIFYIVAPLLIYLDRRRWIYLFLPAFLVVSLLIGRGWSPLHNAEHFFSAYLLGMFFSHYRRETLDFASKTWPILAGLAAVCVFLDYRSVCPWINWNFLQKVILCAVYLWLLEKTDWIVGKWLAPFAAASFGIYFLHPYVMAVMRKGFAFLGYGDGLPSNSLLLLTLLFLLVSGTCLLLVYLGRRLLGPYSRLVIGS